MNESGIVLRPIEGIWFKVDPTKLNKNLFMSKKINFLQEETRQLILDAFYEMEKYPEKYEREFYTLVPKTLRSGRTIKELKSCAEMYNGHMANWVEQALEWAQRISNGETWEDICLKPDLMTWYRIIEWKGGTIRFVGGTSTGHLKCSATKVGTTNWILNDTVYHAVPLIVKYE